MGKVDKARALELLEKQIAAARGVRPWSSAFKKWQRDTEVCLERVFGTENKHVTEFTSIEFAPASLLADPTDAEVRRAYEEGLDHAMAILSSMREEVEDFWVEGERAWADDPDERLEVSGGLRALLQELGAIEAAAARERKFHLEIERLSRWIDRAQAYVREKVGTKEADALRPPRLVYIDVGAAFYGAHSHVHARLATLVDEVERFGLAHLRDRAATSEGQHPKQEGALERVLELLNGFPRYARELARRHENRPGFTFSDEYDVQDALRALLRLHFDDVRPEDAVPARAGGTGRVDFHLKDHGIVVEVKRTRAKLRDKEVGAELLVDCGRYKAHPGCKHLVCLVYDPEGWIQNPRGLERDLSAAGGDLPVTVRIVPLQ